MNNESSIKTNASLYELSHTQKRFWFQEQLQNSQNQTNISASNVHLLFSINGSLDVSVFRKSIQNIVNRHDSLRTCFGIYKGQPIQKVVSEYQVELVLQSNMTSKKQLLEVIVPEEISKPFDLSQLPLLRVHLYATSETEYVCLIVGHHIVLDGVSFDIFMSELVQSYQLSSRQLPMHLPDLPIQYADYAHWFNEQLNSGVYDEKRNYWMDKLSGDMSELDFPLDYPRSGILSYEGDITPIEINKDLFENLKSAAVKENVSLYTYLLAVWNVLLFKYTGNGDIVVGTTLANRYVPELNNIIGSFINTLPVRNQVNGDLTFNDVLQNCRKTVLELYEHQDYPFDKIIEDVGLERDINRNPLFDLLFEFHTLNTEKEERIQVTDTLYFSVENTSHALRFAALDLAIELFQHEAGITGFIQYRKCLFTDKSMQLLARRFECLLEMLTTAANVSIKHIELATPEDKQLIYSFNCNKDYYSNKLIDQLIEEQALLTPDRIAVTYLQQSLTYQELNEKADQMAALLQKIGVKPNRFVAVLSERNPYWMISILAIFKCGAAYLPIDHSFPDERVKFILKDSEADIVITQQCWIDRLDSLLDDNDNIKLLSTDSAAHPASKQKVFILDDYDPSSDKYPVYDSKPDDIAYMIYTSGSTGNPKGALIRHKGMLNHLYIKGDTLQLTENDTVSQAASVSFDVSIWQAFVALLNGACTDITPLEIVRDPNLLYEHLQSKQVTVFETVPSLLFAFIDSVSGMEVNARQLTSLRWLILNGEELPPKLVNEWFEYYPDIPMINAYGPTEASDDITHYTMTNKLEPDVFRVPIGKPLPNLNIFIVDSDDNLCPVGVKGEICVSGVGVGAGYWKNEKLTSEKFTSNPFSTQEDHILYRIGDIGRWLPDGNIEFFGRIDNQVKIRGFRIEIGEIENEIRNYPGIDEVAVIVRKKNNGADPELVCFFTSKHNGNVHEMGDYLHHKLPYYMVPSHFQQLSHFPLLPSEKIDRKALERSKLDSPSIELGLKEIDTPTEAILITMWREILEIEAIGTDDHFFRIGGQSILAIKLANRLKETFQIQIPLVQIFSNPVLKDLAKYVDRLKATQMTTQLEVAPVQETYELAPNQLQQFYLHQLEPDNPFYNVFFELLFKGKMNLDSFVAAWNQILQRHSILRTSFELVDGKPVQKIHPVEKFKFELQDLYQDYRHIPADEMKDEIKRIAYTHSNVAIDFEKPPLIKIKLGEFAENQFVLFFTTHHIIWDETSSMNLLKEFSEIYNAYSTGREPKLPKLEFQYIDYVHWINSQIKNGNLESSRQYWLQQFTPLPEPLNLPADYSKPPLMTYNGSTILDKFDVSTSERIKAFCSQHGVTLYMFVLAVYNLQLYRLTEQREFVVGSPMVNRDDVQFENMLGFFASGIPLKCSIHIDMTFLELLKQVEQTAIHAYNNHLYPVNLLVEELYQGAELSKSKLFSVFFGLQNQKQSFLEALKFHDLDMNFSVFDFIEVSSRFDFTMAIDDMAGGIEINLNYNTDLFKPATAQRIVDQYKYLVEQILQAADQSVDRYKLVSSEEEAVFHEAGSTNYDLSMCIHQLFEQQAEAHPDLIALISEQDEWSYRHLNEWSNQIAHILLQQGIQSEEKVGILFDHSPEVVAAIIAVMKAGGAYVPISSNLPVNRMKVILQEANIRICLTKSSYAVDIAAISPEISFLEVSKDRSLDTLAANPNLQMTSQQLAYVLFTSGSTGVPKGIEVEHRSLNNYMQWMQESFPLSVRDTTMLMSNLMFGPSIIEIFMPLLAGARIGVANGDTAQDATKIGLLADQYDVTSLQFVPVMLESFIRARKNREIPELPSLRYVFSGGATLHKQTVADFYNHFDCKLFNHYGSTESTIDSTSFDCSQPFDGEIVPVGKPIANTQVYILDSALNMVPTGVSGDIYIQSEGLAKGYLGNPALTAEQFIFHSFDGNFDCRLRLYKTGDIGKFDEGGNLTYLGRKDRLIKVRGNRVELDGLEGTINKLDGVDSCALIHYKTDEQDHIVSYIELDPAYTSIQYNEESLKLFTLMQMPFLKKKMDGMHVQTWPSYFEGSAVLREYWPQLYDQFPNYQFMLFNEAGDTVACGNTVPIYWDETVDGIPKGWDGGLIRGIHAEQTPNTLLVLAGVVHPDYQGKGYSSLLIHAFKQLADHYNLNQLLIPVRPTDKAAQPDLDFETYCLEKNDEGHSVDRWVRAHQRMGGKIIGIEKESQRISASIDQWEMWYNTDIKRAGAHRFADTLQDVSIQFDKGIGEYYDPCVWVLHSIDQSYEQHWKHIAVSDIKKQLQQYVPDYMVPSRFVIIEKLPLNGSGKLDRNKLSQLEIQLNERKTLSLPKTQTEETVLHMWKQILGHEQIGTSDAFFELGGHSLKASEFIVKANNHFDIALTLKELFTYQTIQEIASLIDDRISSMDSEFVQFQNINRRASRARS